MSSSIQAKRGYLFFFVLLGVVGAVFLFRGRSVSEDSLLEYVPRQSVALMHVPDLAALGKGVDGAVAQVGLGKRARISRDNLSRQLGFDPLDPEALRSRGVFPEAGVAVYSPPPGSFAVLVLSVKDRAAFEKTLTDIFASRIGARPGEDREHDGVAVHVVETAQQPQAAWAYRSSVVFLSAGPGCVERVASGAADIDTGIGDGLWFRRGVEAVGADADVFLWASADGLGRRIPGQVRSVLESVALGVSVSDNRVAVQGWAGIDAPRRNALDPLKNGGDATRVLGGVDKEALAYGRLTADLGAAWKLLRVGGLPRRLEELSAQLVARGIRIDRDVLPLLDGVFVMDAGLVDSPDIAALSKLDPRRQNPFNYVKTTILAPISDTKRAAELLPDVAAAVARAVRGRLEPAELGGYPVYTIHYRLGPGMTFGIAHDTLVISGGEGAYLSAVTRLAEGGGGLPDDLDEAAKQQIASEGALALLLHVPRLVSTVNDIPSESFGGGPTGMMLRSMVDLFVEPISHLSRVTATFAVDAHGPVVSLEIVPAGAGESDR